MDDTQVRLERAIKDRDLKQDKVDEFRECLHESEVRGFHGINTTFCSDELNNQREELKNDLKLAVEELKAVTLECDVCISDVRSELTSLKLQLEVERRNSRQLEDQLSEMLFEHKQRETELERDKEHDNLHIRGQLQKVVHDLNSKTQEALVLTRQIEIIRQEMAGISKEKDSLQKTFQNMIEEETGRLFELAEQNRGLTSQVGALENGEDLRNQEIIRLKSLLKAAKKRIELQGAVSQNETVKNMATSMSAVEELTSQMVKLEHELHGSNKRLQSANDNNLHFENTLEDLKNTNEKLRKEKKRFKSELARVLNEVREQFLPRELAEQSIADTQSCAQSEINQVLTKVNAFLEMHSQKQQYIDSLRAEDTSCVRQEMREFSEDFRVQLDILKTEHYSRIAEKKTEDLMSNHLQKLLLRERSLNGQLMEHSRTDKNMEELEAYKES